MNNFTMNNFTTDLLTYNFTSSNYLEIIIFTFYYFKNMNHNWKYHE